MMSQNRTMVGVITGLLLVLTSGLYAAEMPLPLDPNYTIPGIVTNSSTVFTIPSVAKPAYGVPFVDSTFGTRVIRLVGNHDQALTYDWPPPGSGTWSDDARQHYQKDQPWNADGTLIALENKGHTPSMIYLDGDTYKPRYAGITSQYDDRWHPKLANIRINGHGNLLEWVDATTSTQVRTWTLPISASYIGSGEGNPSFDGRFVVMANSTQMCVVDMDPQPPFDPYPNKRIGPVYAGVAVSGYNYDWASISPSGKYVVVAYDSPGTDHLRLFDVNQDTLAISVRPTPSGSLRCTKASPCSSEAAANGWIYHLGHADMTLNPFDANEDVIIGQLRSGQYCSQTNLDGSALGQVVMVRLRDNQVLSLTTGSNEATAHHISTRSYDRPGWAYAGYYTGTGRRFGGEVIAVKLDGSGTVERYVHHHSGESVYRAEVHAVPSPDGRRVIFASDWTVNCGSGCGASSNPQAYVVETTPEADLTHGGLVDFEDLEWFALEWLGSGCVTPDWCGGADFNQGGTVDFADFAKFANEWLADSI